MTSLARRCIVLLLSILATACGDAARRVPGSPLEPSPPPDPIVIEGNRNSCVAPADLYPFWRVRSTDDVARVFTVTAYRDPAAGCEPTTANPVSVRPMPLSSPIEATFSLTPLPATCGRVYYVLQADGVVKAVQTVNIGTAC